MIRISEFQMKDVVNVSDGKRLGNIGDIDIDIDTGKIRAVIISKQARMLGLFGKGSRICDSLGANYENWRRCHICKSRSCQFCNRINTNTDNFIKNITHFLFFLLSL